MWPCPSPLENHPVASISLKVKSPVLRMACKTPCCLAPTTLLLSSPPPLPTPYVFLVTHTALSLILGHCQTRSHTRILHLPFPQPSSMWLVFTLLLYPCSDVTSELLFWLKAPQCAHRELSLSHCMWSGTATHLNSKLGRSDVFYQDFESLAE